MTKRTDVMKTINRYGREIVWTYQDEMLDLLDKLENYESQYGLYSGPREIVRELRSIVRRCDIILKETEEA